MSFSDTDQRIFCEKSPESPLIALCRNLETSLRAYLERIIRVLFDNYLIGVCPEFRKAPPARVPTAEDCIKESGFRGRKVAVLSIVRFYIVVLGL